MTTTTTSPLAERILAFAAERQPFAKRDLHEGIADVVDSKLDAQLKSLVQEGTLVGTGHTTLRVFHLPGYEPPAGSSHVRQHEESAIDRVVARAKANGDAPALNGHGKAETTVKLDQEQPKPRRAAAPEVIQDPRLGSLRSLEDLVDVVRDAQVLSTRDLRMEYFDLLMRIVEKAQGDEREDVLDRLEKLIAA